jgi:hypothetical protein
MRKRITMETRDEPLESLVERYRRAKHAKKRRILDEFVELTGYHRKHAIRVLNTWERREKCSEPSPDSITTCSGSNSIKALTPSERADVGEVEPLLGGEQEVEQLGELVLTQAPADPRDQHVALAAGDVGVLGPAGDRGLDDLEDVEVGIGQREAAQLLDRAGAGQLELLALGERDFALAGAGDDLIDGGHPPEYGGLMVGDVGHGFGLARRLSRAVVAMKLACKT